MKYAGIVCAGYGLTLADIGLGGGGGAGSGGDTLAGTIRSERVSKSSGFSTNKKKVSAYFNRILPEELQFGWIDYDEERNIAKSRARLASAQAASMWVDKKIFLPSESRTLKIADGLFSVPVPEDINPNDPEFGGQNEAGGRGSLGQSLGNPVAPSSGGQGEIIPQQVVQRNLTGAEVSLSKAVFNVNSVLQVLLSKVRKNLSEAELDLWDEYVDDYLVGRSEIEEESLVEVLDDINKKAKSVIETQTWTKEFSLSIANQVLTDAQAEEKSRAMFAETEKVEEEFIAGERDGLEVEEIQIDLSVHKGSLEEFTQSKFTDIVSRYVVLIAKSELLSGKLDVDATEATSENIRVSRNVSKEVLRNLSDITKTVYQFGREYLQEKIGEKYAIN
jgi:hypothetical protein